MSKRKNKRSMKLSSYNNNTSKKSFNHTMHRLYDILERDSFLEEQTQFLAKIISGNATAATSGNQIDSFFSFLNGVEQLSYKIRFIDKDSDYNTHEDPNDYVGTPKFPLLVSLHPDAIQETPSQNTHLPPDTIVILSDVDGDGIYKIEKILSEQEAGQFVLGTASASATTQGAFKNKSAGLIGFLSNSIFSALTSNDEPEVKFTGPQKFSKTKSAVVAGKTYRPLIRTYTGSVFKYYNTEIENGVKIDGLHIKIRDYSRFAYPILIKDVVEDFKKLSVAFEQKFGIKIKISDHFRDWKGQVDVRKRKPTKAAKPGRSNHGWGMAFDWDTEWKDKSGFNSETYKWMLVNAPRFGFHNPSWALETGSNPEAWHFQWMRPGELFK